MTTPLLTLAEVKAFMKISTSTDDATLQAIIDGAVIALGNYCNRTFTSNTHSEYRDGKGGSGIQLANYPVTTFTSLSIDGTNIPSGNPGYLAIPLGRRVVLNGYRFNQGQANIVLIYVAGYGDTLAWPADLKLAANQYVAMQYRTKDHLGTQQQRLAGQMVHFNNGKQSDEDGIPDSARSILRNYMNVVPETGY